MADFIQPDWSKVQRAMVIMAHPDDPDFTCAGTCIQMARQGIEVTYMILTNGDKGNHNPAIKREQLIELRKQEQRAAAEVAGVKQVIFMGEEDGFLQPTPELRRRVVREIRRVRPDLVIISHPDRYFVGEGYINHPDHRNAGLVAIEAIFPASDNMMFYPELAEEGYPPHKISQMYVFGHEQPNIKLNISAELETKIAAIICHKTQIANPEEAHPRWLERWGEKQDDNSILYFEQFRMLKFG